MAVAPMVMDDQILGPQRRNAADRARFLSNRKVHRAMHLPAYIQILCFFFKVADLAHPLQHPGQLFTRQFFQQMLAAGRSNRLNLQS